MRRNIFGKRKIFPEVGSGGKGEYSDSDLQALRVVREKESWVDARFIGEWQRNNRRIAVRKLSSDSGNNKIDLSGLQLTSLPPHFFEGCRNVTILDLSGNKLSELPPSFAKLQNLKILKLDENPLGLRSLVERVGGSKNKFPPEILQLKNLEELSCKSCDFESISCEEIAQLPKLRKLDLSGNRFRFDQQWIDLSVKFCALENRGVKIEWPILREAGMSEMMFEMQRPYDKIITAQLNDFRQLLLDQISQNQDWQIGNIYDFINSFVNCANNCESRPRLIANVAQFLQDVKKNPQILPVLDAIVQEKDEPNIQQIVFKFAKVAVMAAIAAAETPEEKLKIVPQLLVLELLECGVEKIEITFNRKNRWYEIDRKSDQQSKNKPEEQAEVANNLWVKAVEYLKEIKPDYQWFGVSSRVNNFRVNPFFDAAHFIMNAESNFSLSADQLVEKIAQKSFREFLQSELVDLSEVEEFKDAEEESKNVKEESKYVRQFADLIVESSENYSIGSNISVKSARSLERICGRSI